MRRVLACTLTATLVGATLVFDVVRLPPGPSGADVVAAPVAPVSTTLPLTAASAGTTGLTSATEPGSPALDTGAVETQDFAVMGVTWDRAPGTLPERPGAEAPVTVEVRVREDDGWTGWTTLDLNDAAPHPGTEEARLAADTVGTEPFVTESADAFQVRVRTPDGEAPDGLEAVVIDPGASPADAGSDALPLTGAGAATAPAVVSRAAWGADESLRRCSPSYSSTVLAGAVHHTAGSNTYTQAQAAGVVRGIYAYHTGTLGWCDIGYNALVDKFGTVYEGRYGGLTKAVRGAHAGGFNDRTFGVSAIGNYETATAPAAMTAAVGDVIGWKLGLFGRSATDTVTLTSAGGSTARYAAGTSVSLPAVFAHRDVGRTACPGLHLYAQMPAVRSAAAARTSVATAPTTSPTPTPSSTPTTTASPTATPTTTATSSPTPTVSPTPTASPTVSPTASPTPTVPPTVDLRGSVLAAVETDLTYRAELLTYAGTATGARHVLDLTTTGARRTLGSGTWTLGWDTVVPVEHDGTTGSEVLLYNRTSGRVAVLDTTAAAATPMLLDRTWAAGWTHVVPVETDGTKGSELLLYNRGTGAVRLVEIRPDATTRTIRSTTWSKGWSAITAAEVDRTARSELSLYSAASGRHLLLDLGTGTSWATRSSTTWATGLDIVVALESDRTSGSELLSYDTQTGRAVVTDIRTSTGGTAVVRTTTWSTGWDRATALEVDGTAGSELALLNSTSGRLLLLDVATNGSAATMR